MNIGRIIDRAKCEDRSSVEGKRKGVGVKREGKRRANWRRMLGESGSNCAEVNGGETRCG